MKKEEPTQGNKKNYQSPVLKDLGRIGEVTNTSANNNNNGQDGGANTYAS